jgi:plastocyanin
MRHPRLTLFFVLTGLALRAADGSLAVRVLQGQMPLADAVVSLTPLDTSVPPPVAFPEVIIAQEDKEFDPYVTPVMAGTRIVFPNRDTVQHHIYSLSKPKRFEKPLYASGASESVLFDLPGVVALGCNIHDWMIGYIVILPTPWFAKSDAGGRAVVGGFPAGRYRLEVWHPRLARPVTREVMLAAGENPPEPFTLQLKPDRRIRRTSDGRPGGY